MEGFRAKSRAIEPNRGLSLEPSHHRIAKTPEGIDADVAKFNMRASRGSIMGCAFPVNNNSVIAALLSHAPRHSVNRAEICTNTTSGSTTGQCWQELHIDYPQRERRGPCITAYLDAREADRIQSCSHSRHIASSDALSDMCLLHRLDLLFALLIADCRTSRHNLPRLVVRVLFCL